MLFISKLKYFMSLQKISELRSDTLLDNLSRP